MENVNLLFFLYDIFLHHIPNGFSFHFKSFYSLKFPCKTRDVKKKTPAIWNFNMKFNVNDILYLRRMEEGQGG
ncbi:hypothetical protein A8L44_11505 [Bacillus sp. FJAT-27986]|nr:hypothetical protein A8L44_11505 [Bacillus sp. FJAT-27986]